MWVTGYATNVVLIRLWWTKAVSAGTNCSQNCRNSARLLSNPRTTVTVSSQVLLHQNRGRDSTIQNREDTLAVFTTKVCRTNTLLLYSPRSSNQSMLLEERFLGSSPAPRNDSTMWTQRQSTTKQELFHLCRARLITGRRRYFTLGRHGRADRPRGRKIVGKQGESKF